MSKDITNLWKVTPEFDASEDDVNCEICLYSKLDSREDYRDGSFGPMLRRHFYTMGVFGTYCSDCCDVIRWYSKRLWVGMRRRADMSQQGE